MPDVRKGSNEGTRRALKIRKHQKRSRVEKEIWRDSDSLSPSHSGQDKEAQYGQKKRNDCTHSDHECLRRAPQLETLLKAGEPGADGRGESNGPGHAKGPRGVVASPEKHGNLEHRFQVCDEARACTPLRPEECRYEQSGVNEAIKQAIRQKGGRAEVLELLAQPRGISLHWPHRQSQGGGMPRGI
eukprot:TRINITY_DN18438_c0_g1_i2.p2 TRINITY_DN18438_c0_g1~~TRINITY_DN18438_c0_g1_i2.p2  ORF type:complete len:186 (+),score=16.21 TRINITY_DN18438_c0_g1_i2:344-901(+)